MSILTSDSLPDQIVLWHDMQDLEKRAAARMSGVLQATKTGHLLVGVPTALVRGVFDAMDEPGISLPVSVDGGALRAGIVAMTPEELDKVGGPGVITERGKQYPYQLGSLVQTTARNWPGVTACWHLEIKSPELLKLRRTYGLSDRLPGDNKLSIVVACRKSGVLGTNATSKSVTESSPTRLPDWTLP